MKNALSGSACVFLLFAMVTSGTGLCARAVKAKKTMPAAFSLQSFALENRAAIPKRYANTGINGGENISLPLFWSLAPKQTKSFALAMTDISANNFPHWMVVNIPAGTINIDEGASMTSMPDGSFELFNGFESVGYGGPEPPLWSGKHTYVITLYALNTANIKLKREAKYQDFLNLVTQKTISSAALTGTFSRF